MSEYGPNQEIENAAKVEQMTMDSGEWRRQIEEAGGVSAEFDLSGTKLPAAAERALVEEVDNMERAA